MGDGRTSKLASQDIGAPFSRGYPLFSHPQAPTGTLLPPITSSTFSLALSLPSCVPGLPSPLAKLPFGPLSRLQARSTFLRILSHSSFIAATWLPRTASWSSIFIYQSSRSRIEAIDRGTTTLQIFYPFFPRSRYHLSLPIFYLFSKYACSTVEETILNNFVGTINLERYRGNRPSKRPYRVSDARTHTHT